MGLRRRIRLIYITESLPCSEEFGGLPTDLVPVDYRALLKKSKKLLIISFKLDVPKGGLRTS